MKKKKETKNNSFHAAKPQMDKGKVQLFIVIFQKIVSFCCLARHNKSSNFTIPNMCFLTQRERNILRILMTLQRIAGSTATLVSKPVCGLTRAVTLLINWVSLSKDGNFLSNLSPWNTPFLALSVQASGNEMDEKKWNSMSCITPLHVKKTQIHICLYICALR